MDAGIFETFVQPPWRPVVADLSSSDRPQKTNGASNGQHENTISASEMPGDEQTLADSEQTLADSDQTLADTDQSRGDRDQTSADRDQVASDRDQAASDRDLAHGVDPEEYGASRDIRRRTARQREQTAAARLESAHERDATARSRDLAGLARDRAATARDLAMAHSDADYARDGMRAATGAEIVLRAAEQRKRAAEYRVQAAAYREQAAQDRAAAATDREQGARDRLQALADREALTRALQIAEVDPLTGARTRAAGLIDFEHEVDRVRLTGGSLVVAYVEAVGLKRVNDSEGHDAGDRLLKRVVALSAEHLRSYDLIVRLAGDEFLCAMSNVTLDEAHERFSSIAGALAGASEAGAIRTGFAELTDDDSATELIARADSQLIASRHD